MKPFVFLKKEDPLKQELLALVKKESRLKRAAVNARPAQWKLLLEERVPDKVYEGLESTFCKGFSLVFKHGRGIIEKSYSKEELQALHRVRHEAVSREGSRRELKKMTGSARKGDLLNLTATTLEGVGLGALGVGMPDIVLFLGNLLKGVYEAALSYGFDYESPGEQLLILKLLETSLTTGTDWLQRNAEVEQMLTYETVGITDRDFEEQLKKTASVFAMDMLVLKFIQGLPVVGIFGGAANPVYYHKIMKYVQLKYKKRYLYQQLRKGGSESCLSSE